MINRVVEKSVPISEWVIIDVLLRNLTDSYDQWVAVKFDGLRNDDKSPTFNNLIEELVAEEYRLGTAGGNANIARKQVRKKKQRPIYKDCKKAGRKSFYYKADDC